MTTTLHERRADGAAVRAKPAGHAPAGRRTRLPEVVVGVAMMVAFALGAVLWHLSTTERVAALALSRPVHRGTVIGRADLRVVYLPGDGAVAHLDRTRASVVLGRTARADMPAGTLLTAASVDSGESLGAGEGVVGLSLSPGQVPVDELVPGDLVDVVSAAGPGSPPQAAPDVANVVPDPAPSGIVASGAAVYAVGKEGVQGKRVVSIRLPKDDANRVAMAAERGDVRLVLVGRP